jgi:uncharacterized protein
MTLKTTRRRFIASACVAGTGFAASGFASSSFVADPGPKRARYFPLTDVRLGAGPFLAAQKLDEDYLLRLEPDRMLHNFRTNAGLAPRAPVYGGWESVEPWVDIRCHGHTLGHYLTAAACMHQSTGDARFAERVDYIVTELAQCQSKTGAWLTAFPDGVAPLADSLAGKSFAGVPWYTTHKVLAGLRDAHAYCGSKPALEVMARFAEWIDAGVARVKDPELQKMLDREHGGMNEVLADLCEMTGEKRYGRLAMRFSHAALLDPLAAGRDTLDGLHANTQIPKVIGFSRIHDLSRAEEYGRAARFFWETVVRDRSFATGGHGDGEHFFPKTEFEKHLGSAKTMETCCTHNMLRLTRSLYAREGSAGYFDYYERALFNGILASQDPLTGMNSYFQATRPGYVRLYHTPFDSFWCCTGSGIENHARYAESIYAHDDSTLFVNLFLSSRLEWRARQLSIEQVTRFPDSGVVRLSITRGSPQELTLAIRQPAWCPEMTIKVDGRTTVARQPGEYARIKRRFAAGDALEIQLPMSARLEPLPRAPEYTALAYGPVTLAARLGTTGLTPGSQLIVNERESGRMLNDVVPIPRWNRALEDLPGALVRTADGSLDFTARGFDAPGEVGFAPYFRLTHERYNLYLRRS